MSGSNQNPNSRRRSGPRRSRGLSDGRRGVYRSTERLHTTAEYDSYGGGGYDTGHDSYGGGVGYDARSVRNNENGSRGNRNRSRSLQARNNNEGARPKIHGNPRPKRELRPTGYKRLEELLSKESEEILMQLSATNFGFEKLINGTEEIRRDLRALILRAIVCACECTTARASLYSFLGMVQTSQFVRYHLMHHIMSLKDDRDDRINYRGEIDNIMSVIKTLVETLPSSTREVKAPLMLLEPTITELEEEGLIDDTFNQRLHDLNAYCKAVESTQGEDVKKNTRRKTFTNADEENPPPDDFRQIPIFPTLNDLTMDNRPYLRRNMLDGSYDNVDHYLDVQFRLLREDMVRPLREGIKEYLQYKNDRNRRITDIRVYNDVTIEYPVCSHDCIIYRVHFDVTRFKGIRWQSSKRLIYGSLVCLSADDFQTVCFATVANREPSDLEKGYLEIQFENEDELDDIRNKSFVMVETSAFFEAYRHVLRSLQEITENSMPMKNYIVNASQEVRAPRYLRHNRNMTYDLAPLIDNCASKRGMCIRIAGSFWPNAESLKLDESQFSALKTALTKEFSVIQGPPGTGKTYIGLKIVHALLHNQECWTIDEVRGEVKERPILVVCFTNHALDQFIEGIHKFLPSDIVRVGGRSSSEALKKFNLAQLRQKSRERKEVPRHILDRKKDILREMHALKDVMKLAEESIKITTAGVIDQAYLEGWMSEKHFKSLEEDGPGLNNSIISWLGLCGGSMEFESDTFADNATDDKTDEVEIEETEEIDVAEEADLMTEQRLVDVDDTDDTNQRRSMDEIEKIKKSVRKQLAYDTYQAQGQSQNQEDSDGFITVVNKKKRDREIKRQLERTDKMSDFRARLIHNVWDLKLNDRWLLYRLWKSKYCEHERQKLFNNQEKYNTLGKLLQEVKLEEDLQLMRGAKLIGMTTTGAARCREMIQRIQPKIVVVEEAAEVLEAHIVSSLTEGCEHLILIGDHQQLRPNPTVYELAKKFNLEISLFERMLKNGMKCQKLTIQHRMRPQISSIMKNHFYNGLQDAPNVYQYDHIKGVETNMFFIEHEHKEDAVNDTMSKSNVYEAEFLVRLCKYLIQQGYKPSSITILTTYTGQLFQFKKIMKSAFFKGVRVCAVDNYQGEENEIILLSLVRSNAAGKIGFLKEETRMCVALSRAKNGLFCIGNMKLLATQDPHWNKIVSDLRQKKLIGRTIQLRCQNHPNKTVEIRELSDFTKCPEGGCNEPCLARLNCGHVCRLPCHPYDREHKDIKCMEKCTKVVCPVGHPCKRRCYMKCEEKCTVSVKRLLICGHMQEVPCSKEISTVKCLSVCRKKLQCGHPCKTLCSQPCTSKCEEIISKLWPCGHRGEYKCHVDDPLACSTPCDVILKCDHPCQGTCGGCKNGRLHKQCTSKCDRTLVCGHGCQEPCTRNCPPCRRPCENRCVHSKCPKNCGEKCTPCRMPCEWQCKHNRCTMQCGELCNRVRCNKPCDKILRKCGHPCAGLCGEPCPKKCLICDKEELTTILFGNEEDEDARFIELEDCGHVIESEALDTWMDQEDEKNKSVQSKVCPICKTPIRRNLRYGNIIKQLQMDIERVKAKINGDEKQIHIDKYKLELEISKLSDREFRNVLRTEVDTLRTPDQVVDMKNKLQFIIRLQKIVKGGEGKIIPRYAIVEENIKRELDICRTWILKPRNRFSDQLLEDIATELQRLAFYMELYVLKSLIYTRKINTDSIQEYIHLVKKSITAVGPLKEANTRVLKFCLKKISEKCGAIAGISDTERVEIVKAMGLSKGHWFKCPKGHIYAIGDCGGATIESKCYECGATIGGSNHRLRDDNKLAGEMDGAHYAAWSEQTNLENYRFEL